MSSVHPRFSLWKYVVRGKIISVHFICTALFITHTIHKTLYISNCPYDCRWKDTHKVCVPNPRQNPSLSFVVCKTLRGTLRFKRYPVETAPLATGILTAYGVARGKILFMHCVCTALVYYHQSWDPRKYGLFIYLTFIYLHVQPLHLASWWSVWPFSFQDNKYKHNDFT